MADGDEATGEMSDGLQVELFHPDSDREPGDTNIQKFGFDIHPVVFPVALAIIAVFVASTILFQDAASELYGQAFSFVNGTFGWFYILAVNIFILTVLYFAFSKFGNIKIGGVEAEKEFSDFSWMAMLFSAGMGIGLMFFSVTEPMGYLSGPPALFGAEAGTGAAASAALAQTFFHWGFSPWAVYGLVGLGLAFFSFNRGLPLTFRSIFWPVLGERIYGWPGHIIDILTVFATLFGLTTSLGLGAQQINAGLNFLGGNVGAAPAVPFGTTIQVAIIAGVTAVAVLSVAAGLDGGVRRLSNLNLLLMFGLLGSVLVLGPTLFIFEMIPQGLGQYLGNFFDLAFFTGAVYEPYFQGAPYYGPGGGGEGAFLVDWTVFYWAWWIAWSPFVGMFIARISKGRTVREFIGGVLILPVLFSVMWFAALGGSALSIELSSGAVSAAMFADGVQVPRAVALFSMLDQLPGTIILSLISVLLISTFFITSSDSGSLVIDHLTSGGKHDAPVMMRVFWAVTEGAVAATLLIAGGSQGLQALQAAAISTGLPFAFILVFMMYSIHKGLDTEYQVLESQEFQQRVEEMAEEGEVVIDRAGGEVVTDISASEEEPGD